MGWSWCLIYNCDSVLCLQSSERQFCGGLFNFVLGVLVSAETDGWFPGIKFEYQSYCSIVVGLNYIAQLYHRTPKGNLW
jgi:hypothetical protein